MVGGTPLTLEIGRLAKQAEASVLLTYGETQVLVTLCYQEPRAGMDFFPLTCDYVEKTYAAGKIPGGFFKREGRLRDAEVLSSRLIDRPVRPLFPSGFKMDTQLMATVMSADPAHRPDVLAVTGASAALHVSSLPWEGPIAALRVGRIEGKLIANPTFQDLEKSDLDIVVASSRDAIVMVEGGGAEISEKELADALEFAHESSQPVIDLIEELRSVVGKPKIAFEPPTLDAAIKARISQLVDEPLMKAALIREKHARYDSYRAIKQQMKETLLAELGPERFVLEEKLIAGEFDHRKYELVRGYVLREKRRIDGRGTRDIRPISTDAGILLRAHGSALFQRGETQAIATTTLGTSSDEQKIDALNGESWKRFYLHYNFPPFCTGEVKFLRGPSRREVGHGALAERAIERVIPTKEQFPYTIRLVSETLESNGSSSMAAVCGCCMSLMDAGVPILAPVAGIAMGLITDGKDQAVLSDILGDEDHLGDMDFKVCGTAKGITAIQMDIKVKGLTRALMLEALEQAREGRLHILGKMLEALPAPRPELSKYAPRIETLKVKPEQIRLIIGPGGKTIKGIVDQTGVTIDVEDDGTVNVASPDADALRRAIEIIEGLTAEPEVGKVYDGIVRRVADFGAFVEILPNWDGLVHISELAHGRTERVEDVCKEGDRLMVKVLSVDSDGKVRLSHRETLPPPEGGEIQVRDRDGGGGGDGNGEARRRVPRRRGGTGGGGGGRDDRRDGPRRRR
jgi:polyribonucleotide nucleotidyltransferase